MPTGHEIFPDNFDYEFDGILTQWRELIVKAHHMGVKSVVIHIDEFTENDYEELFALIHKYNLILGITVSNDISVDVIIKAIHKIESSPVFTSSEKVFIQVMGLRNVALEKHPFDERILHRIRVLKKLFPTCAIQVSGRITPETIVSVKEAGADRVVVSSYIFGHENLEEAITNLVKAIIDNDMITADTIDTESEHLNKSIIEIPNYEVRNIEEKPKKWYNFLPFFGKNK